MFPFRIIILLFLVPYIVSGEDQNIGVFGKIKSGLHLASKLLGLDAASGVAQLVSDTFGTAGAKPKKGDTTDEQNHILFSGFFRLLGLDAGKLGAIAINGLIFLAQLISTSLGVKNNPKVNFARSFNGDSPLQWFYNNNGLVDLISSAKNENLPDRLIEYVQERSTDEETACVQLMICKSSPLLWGMQKRIENTPNKHNSTTLSGAAPMFQYLPNIEEVADYGDTCENKYPMCRIID